MTLCISSSFSCSAAQNVAKRFCGDDVKFLARCWHKVIASLICGEQGFGSRAGGRRSHYVFFAFWPVLRQPAEPVFFEMGRIALAICLAFAVSGAKKGLCVLVCWCKRECGWGLRCRRLAAAWSRRPAPPLPPCSAKGFAGRFRRLETAFATTCAPFTMTAARMWR